MLTMDNELFQRFLNGEPAATTGVRNHLRAIASRVLAAPQWRLSGAEQTRTLEVQAAKEAMAAPGDTVLTCATGALLASTNLGLLALRQREALPMGHPDSLTVAREVVGVLGATEKEALLEHLEQCGTCTRHLEMAKSAVNAAFSASATQASAKQAKDSAQDVAFSTGRKRTPARKRKSPRLPPRKRPKRELHPNLMEQGRHSLTSTLVPLFVLISILGYLTYTRSIETEDERLRRLADLLAQELPPTALADDLDPSARGAVLDMRRGHCDSASSRLSSAADNARSDATLTYYAGLAHLCARHPERSLQYFERLNSLTDAPFFGQEWWYTQVLILNNQTDEARARLAVMIEDEHPRTDSASLQLLRLEEAGL